MEVYIFLGYCALVFIGTNILAKKYVERVGNVLSRWIVIPVGGLLCMAVIFLVASLFPDWLGIGIMVPFVCFYVGVVAHLTFAKVASLNKKASEMMKK
ncbi:hypothetical protein [Culicoidibacter larvae]|uniref:Uncharacterized protein n=1 Tax=Culicoidibacter larvae TaxID=2579976 RepID=A0A5R8QAT3_9FIRM|nr:hypothetical protein [Culicoidibacter larvae]TLG73003.1 hypothetical protein FEZ08_08125 [Culicoidibacter larvae]